MDTQIKEKELVASKSETTGSVPLRSQELEVAGKLVELSLELVRLIRAEQNATIHREERSDDRVQ